MEDFDNKIICGDSLDELKLLSSQHYKAEVITMFDEKTLKKLAYSKKDAILACKQAWQGGFDFGTLNGKEIEQKRNYALLASNCFCPDCSSPIGKHEHLCGVCKNRIAVPFEFSKEMLVGMFGKVKW